MTDEKCSECCENEKALLDQTVTEVLNRLVDIETKLVNMANKLDEHLKARDAHNPAIMRD